MGRQPEPGPGALPLPRPRFPKRLRLRGPTAMLSASTGSVHGNPPHTHGIHAHRRVKMLPTNTEPERPRTLWGQREGGHETRTGKHRGQSHGGGRESSHHQPRPQWCSVSKTSHSGRATSTALPTTHRAGHRTHGTRRFFGPCSGDQHWALGLPGILTHPDPRATERGKDEPQSPPGPSPEERAPPGQRWTVGWATTGASAPKTRTGLRARISA